VACGDLATYQDVLATADWTLVPPVIDPESTRWVAIWTGVRDAKTGNCMEAGPVHQHRGALADRNRGGPRLSRARGVAVEMPVDAGPQASAGGVGLKRRPAHETV